MKRFRISDQARLDLLEIHKFIANGSIAAANAHIRTLREQSRKLLSRFPLSGVLREDLAPGLRVLPIGNYLIFYRVSASIEVVRVLHGARDLNSEFRE